MALNHAAAVANSSNRLGADFCTLRRPPSNNNRPRAVQFADQQKASDQPHPVVIATMPPVSEAAISKNFMYATMRPPPPPRSSGNAGNAVVNAIDLFPDFVPPPPPM